MNHTNCTYKSVYSEPPKISRYRLCAWMCYVKCATTLGQVTIILLIRNICLTPTPCFFVSTTSTFHSPGFSWIILILWKIHLIFEILIFSDCSCGHLGMLSDPHKDKHKWKKANLKMARTLRIRSRFKKIKRHQGLHE